jgi:hypothetical protein
VIALESLLSQESGFVLEGIFILLTLRTGAILVRFEFSLESRRTLFLRIVKIVTPVECRLPSCAGRVQVPREGEYISSILGGRGLNGALTRWSYSIDKPHPNLDALRLLMDE